MADPEKELLAEFSKQWEGIAKPTATGLTRLMNGAKDREDLAKSKQVLSYDDLTHTYTLGDRVIPSVTQILSRGGFINDTSFYTREACDRGRAVHTAIQYWHEDDLDPESIALEYTGYVGAFMQFVHKTGYEREFNEKLVYSPSQDYAGRADLIGRLNGRRVLIDIKTGKAPKWVGAQLAGYGLALAEMGYPIRSRFCLELRPDLTYTLTAHNEPSAMGQFFEALNVSRGMTTWQI